MIIPKESEDLKEEHVVRNGWDKPDGTFTYNINYLHDDWGSVVQTYTPYTTNEDGEPIYSSDFVLFQKGAKIPSDFRDYDYPKELIIRLWMVIFAIKARFFKEYQPAEVEHFIKQPYSVKDRLPVYYKNLNLPEYDILIAPQTIIYKRKKLSN